MNNATNELDERAGLPSASYMPIIWPCPASWQRSKAVPASTDKVEEWTAQGESIHAALETGDDAGLDESEAEIAQRLRQQETDSLARWKEQYSLFGQNATVVREERLWVRDAKTLKPLCSAKLDSFVIIGPHAFLDDHKSGYAKTVPADSNKQLLTQVVALWHEYPELRNIRAAINASRIKSYFDYVDFDTNDIIQSDVLLRAKLREANSPNPSVTPGQHCRYCRAKAWCKEAAAFASLHVTVAKTPGMEIATKEQAVTAVAQLDPVSLAEIQKRKAVIGAILEAVDDRLKAMPDEELGKIGLKRKPGAKRKVITDQAAALDLIRHEIGVMADVCVKVDRKAFSEQLADKLCISKKAAAECADKVLASVTTEEKNEASVTEI